METKNNILIRTFNNQVSHILILVLFPVLLAVALPSAANAQFRQNTSRSLFSDVKAYREGDAVMILITEGMSANNSSETGESRSTSLSGSGNISAGAGTNPKIGADLSTGNQFSGKGSISRSESIQSKMSARIVEVDSAGNLNIEGKRTTKINGETQTIVIKGYVRPVDILPNNSVYSYSILDLTLTIEGDGTISKTQEPGLITKFLRILF